MIRILLVGGQTLCRAGLRALVQNSAELEVLQEEASGAEAILLAKKLKPDVILMDTTLVDAKVIEATSQIHAAQPEIRIIVLSARTSRQYLYEALQAGAVGFLSKDAASSELLTAIRAVMTSGTYVSPSVAHLVVDRYFRRTSSDPVIGDLAVLSKREREVLKLIADGNSSAEIGKALRITSRTVDAHRHNLMKKLDIHSIAGLTKFAIRQGLSSI